MGNLLNQQFQNRIMLKTGLWMALLNGVLLNLISYHYLSVTAPIESVGEGIYLYSFSITHFFFIALIPFLLVFLPTCLLNTKHTERACMIGSSIAYGIFLIFIVLDSYIYYLYRFHFNSTVVEQMLGPGAGQVFELSTEMFIGAAVIITIIFLIQVFLFKMSHKLAEKVSYRNEMRIALAIFGIYAGCQIVHAVAAAKGNRAITRCDRYFPICKPLNINRQLVSMNVEAPLKYKLDLNGHQFNYPKHPITGNGGGKNIIVIALDSWTYNSLDSTNCPNIFKFSKKCSQFNHHYSGGNCTRNGVFSMFYGLPGTYWYDFMEQQISPVLIDELIKDNYSIRLYPSASMQNPAFDKNALVKVAEQCGPTEGSKAWERDRNLALNFIKKLKEKKDGKPIFSLLFFDSLHSMILPDSSEYKAPFQPTWEFPKYLEVGNNTDPVPFYNLYKNMLFYIDSYFAKIVAALEENGMMENSIIIVTGDHGQEFNENGKNFWGHNGNFSVEQVQVPLLYYAPAQVPKQYDHWTSHFDLAATLMQEALGVNNPTIDYTVGRSLFNTNQRHYMVTDGYNGIAITDEDGTITDIFYDGEYQISDRHLNQLLDKQINKQRVEDVLNTISSFYKD